MKSELLKKLDVITHSSEEDWNDSFSDCSDYTVIKKANSLFHLDDYLSDKLQFETLSSSSGWTKKSLCPFHKQGHERTASFFVNSIKNIFYCQACGVSGSIVEFISKYKNIPQVLVAEHLIKIKECGFSYIEVNDEKKKINERRIKNKKLIDISNICRDFLSTNGEGAFAYMNKFMQGFDFALSVNRENIENNIDEVTKNLKSYLGAYK